MRTMFLQYQTFEGWKDGMGNAQLSRNHGEKDALYSVRRRTTAYLFLRYLITRLERG
jgi:hypothetical protein